VTVEERPRLSGWGHQAGRVALWIGATALSAGIAYRMITGHFSVDGDDQEVLAMALALPGLVVTVIMMLRER